MRRVLRDFGLGLIIFLALEALCFNTALYQSLLEPRSPAGHVRIAVDEELARPTSGLREVLVVGDSRFVEGFSADLANREASRRGSHFVAIAINGSTLRSWYYMLRELDPDANRYAAVVLPLYFIDDFEYYPNPQNWFDVDMLAPLLRYSDTLDMVSSYDTSKLRFDVLRACTLKGYALREDVQNLLRRPARRFRHLRDKHRFIADSRSYTGNLHDLIGFHMDEQQRLVFDGKSAAVPRKDRRFIRQELRRVPSESGSAAYRALWLGRIVDHYRDTDARVVLVRPPRGPIIVHEVPGPNPESVARRLVAEGALSLIPESTFVDLERPALFFDAKHLNSAGRRVFSTRLVQEILSILDTEN